MTQPHHSVDNNSYDELLKKFNIQSIDLEYKSIDEICSAIEQFHDPTYIHNLKVLSLIRAEDIECNARIALLIDDILRYSDDFIITIITLLTKALKNNAN